MMSASSMVRPAPPLSLEGAPLSPPAPALPSALSRPRPLRPDGLSEVNSPGSTPSLPDSFAEQAASESRARATHTHMNDQPDLARTDSIAHRSPARTPKPLRA